MAVISTSIAVAILVLVSLIFQYGDNFHKDLTRIVSSRQIVKDRVYELTGNIWVQGKWILDPYWQQDGNKDSGLSNGAKVIRITSEVLYQLS